MRLMRPLFNAILLVFLSFPFVFGGGSVVAQDRTGRGLTILYTNDFHSAIEPARPAYWLPGSPKLGGAAELTGLINQIRRRERAVFLFDSGDMFTGMLSFQTRGEAIMEMMHAMRYDAMAIGNHEFDSAARTREVQLPVMGRLVPVSR